MAAAQPSSAARSGNRSVPFGRSFAGVLLAIGTVLLLLGAAGFGYLRVHGPMGLLSGGSRPIAAATVFVPTRSPFTISLLTSPERLLALQQAVVSPARRSQAQREIEQLQRSLQDLTGLDYFQSVQSWVGEEITFAYTSADLDRDKANGQQPGYLLAIEIAPGKRSQAQEFLQLFWQQQSLAGYPPQSQRVSGVPILSAAIPSAQLNNATALVGSEFVLFSNSAEVIRSSIRAAQTAKNLAQNRAYRQAAEQLPEQRIVLAYLNTQLLSQTTLVDIPTNKPTGAAIADPDSFAAISIGLTRIGLTADVRIAGPAGAEFPTQAFSVLPDQARSAESTVESTAESTAESTEPLLQAGALEAIPDSSQLVISGGDLYQLISKLDKLEERLGGASLSTDLLPRFLALGRSPDPDLRSDLRRDPWRWSGSRYALAQLNGTSRGQYAAQSAQRSASSSSADWILSVARADSAIAALDAAAAAEGYSLVPVQISDRSATAWTRFTANTQRRRSGSALETELLGLHLQQGDYEIFASSIEALESALTERSLAQSVRFQQAIAPLGTVTNGYLYLDWPTVAPAVGQVLPVLDSVQSVARPLTDHIGAIAATSQGKTARLFIQLNE